MTPAPEPAIPTHSVRHPAYADVSDAQWSDWRWQMRSRVTRLEPLAELVELTDDERRGIEARGEAFGFAITPYYLSLIGAPGCPVRRQAIPHVDELKTTPWDLVDPLVEDAHAVTPILTHRYPLAQFQEGKAHIFDYLCGGTEDCGRIAVIGALAVAIG